MTCQLAQYLDSQGDSVTIRGKDYAFSDIRNEKDLGYFATAKTLRASYTAMRVGSKVIGKPGAEVWEVLRLSGKGSVVARFAIHANTLVELG